MAIMEGFELAIAIDFDGTIAKHDYPGIGEPVPGAFQWMQEFRDEGALLILWTMRDGHLLEKAIRYCQRHGIEFDYHNTNERQKWWTTSPKAYAQVYIDDLAFGCPLVECQDGGRPWVDWSIVGPSVVDKIRRKALHT